MVDSSAQRAKRKQGVMKERMENAEKELQKTRVSDKSRGGEVRKQLVVAAKSLRAVSDELHREREHAAKIMGETANLSSTYHSWSEKLEHEIGSVVGFKLKLEEEVKKQKSRGNAA